MSTALRIAIAEDEPDVSEYLQELLPRLGHRVVATAQNGRQLVDQCRKLHPDLVITDIKMPGMDGVDAAVAINRDRQTPVILLSAYHDVDVQSRAGTDPIMAYLVKPVREPDVVAAVSLAMTRFKHLADLGKQTEELRHALEDRKIIERAKGATMKRLGIGEGDAYRLMQRRASEHNRKLKEVAAEIIQAEEVFEEMEQVTRGHER
jgi:two-component system, response regulator PdtaR